MSCRSALNRSVASTDDRRPLSSSARTSAGDSSLVMNITGLASNLQGNLPATASTPAISLSAEMATCIMDEKTRLEGTPLLGTFKIVSASAIPQSERSPPRGTPHRQSLGRGPKMTLVAQSFLLIANSQQTCVTQHNLRFSVVMLNELAIRCREWVPERSLNTSGRKESPRGPSVEFDRESHGPLTSAARAL